MYLVLSVAMGKYLSCIPLVFSFVARDPGLARSQKYTGTFSAWLIKWCSAISDTLTQVVAFTGALRSPPGVRERCETTSTEP